MGPVRADRQLTRSALREDDRVKRYIVVSEYRGVPQLDRNPPMFPCNYTQNQPTLDRIHLGLDSPRA